MGSVQKFWLRRAGLPEIVAPRSEPYETGLIGGASYDQHGEPLTIDTLVQAKSSDAVHDGRSGRSEMG